VHEDFEKCLRDACMWASTVGKSYYIIQDDMGGCVISEHLPEKSLWNNSRYRVMEVTPQFGAVQMKAWEKESIAKAKPVVRSRSHEECDECQLQEVEPPQCSGHAPGPTSCKDFKPWTAWRKGVMAEKARKKRAEANQPDDLGDLEEIHPDDFDRWMKVAELGWRMAEKADIHNLLWLEPHPTPYGDRPVCIANTKMSRVRVVIRYRALGHDHRPGKWREEPVPYSRVVDGLIDALATLRFEKGTQQWDWAKDDLADAASFLVNVLGLYDADVSVSAAS